jgi:hypothetical protein
VCRGVALSLNSDHVYRICNECAKVLVCAWNDVRVRMTCGGAGRRRWCWQRPAFRSRTEHTAHSATIMDYSSY